MVRQLVALIGGTPEIGMGAQSVKVGAIGMDKPLSGLTSVIRLIV